QTARAVRHWTGSGRASNRFEVPVSGGFDTAASHPPLVAQRRWQRASKARATHDFMRADLRLPPPLTRPTLRRPSGTHHARSRSPRVPDIGADALPCGDRPIMRAPRWGADRFLRAARKRWEFAGLGGG